MKVRPIGLLLLAPSVLAASTAAGQIDSSRMSALPPGSQVIQHVVLIVQENRSTDNLFHGLPGADIANKGRNSRGKIIPLTPEPLANNYDLGHHHSDFVDMYDHGKMDGADKITTQCAGRGQKCVPPNPQFKYVNPSDVAPYFQLAEQYTFADRMFQTNQGSSYPAHQFLLAGTSAPTATSDMFVAENPDGFKEADRNTGCTAPQGEYVYLVDPRGQENVRIYPCFEHLTLPDLLDNQGVSWRYYAPSAGSSWTAPNSIQHLRDGPDWQNNVVLNNVQVLSDIANGQLAQVSWVIPTGQSSDHALSNDGSGPSWVASVVNAIGTSQYWANTATFIVWDDWGGWYDHVRPPKVLVDCQQWGCGYIYGFRVPLIIVSPYAKQGYVSHKDHDFGSILKFTEKVFNLPSLGYADALADDLSDCFNFSQKPTRFRTIAAPRDANYFLNNRTPPTDPDDD